MLAGSVKPCPEVAMVELRPPARAACIRFDARALTTAGSRGVGGGGAGGGGGGGAGGLGGEGMMHMRSVLAFEWIVFALSELNFPAGNEIDGRDLLSERQRQGVGKIGRPSIHSKALLHIGLRLKMYLVPC